MNIAHYDLIRFDFCHRERAWFDAMIDARNEGREFLFFK